MSRKMVERRGIEPLQRLGFSPDVSFTRLTPRKWVLVQTSVSLRGNAFFDQHPFRRCTGSGWLHAYPPKRR